MLAIVRVAKEIAEKVFVWLDSHGVIELALDQQHIVDSWQTHMNWVAIAGTGIIALWVITIRHAVERWQEKRVEKDEIPDD